MHQTPPLLDFDLGIPASRNVRGLLGEGFGCGFVKTAKGYSNEKSLRGKGEHSMDSQAVV